MHLITLDLLGKPLKLEGSMAGWQQLIWGDVCVSQITASDSQLADSNVHEFELTQQTAKPITTEGEQSPVQDGSLEQEAVDKMMLKRF